MDIATIKQLREQYMRRETTYRDAIYEYTVEQVQAGRNKSQVAAELGFSRQYICHLVKRVERQRAEAVA